MDLQCKVHHHLSELMNTNILKLPKTDDRSYPARSLENLFLFVEITEIIHDLSLVVW